VADRNFDGLTERFQQRIYGSAKGRIREQLLWQQLTAHCTLINDSSTPLSVLDAAGGLAQMSVRVVAKNHLLHYNDISVEMVAHAREALKDYNGVRFSHGPIQGIDHNDRYDLIFCHALLEWLDDPKSVVEQLISQLTKGGVISLAFYNRHALVINNTLKGNERYLTPKAGARKAKRKGLSPPNAQFPEDVIGWLDNLDVEIIGHYGVRVLSDWLPADVVVTDQRLIEIESYYSHREPYRSMGRYVHLVIRKS